MCTDAQPLKYQRNKHCIFFLNGHSSVCTELIKKVLSLDGKIKSIANELYQQRSLLVMGRGFHYATCLEGALVSWDWQSSLSANKQKHLLH